MFKYQGTQYALEAAKVVSIPFIGSNLFKLEIEDISTKNGKRPESPLSGQICLNSEYHKACLSFSKSVFQSPLSGQICLNVAYIKVPQALASVFQSPLSGQICLNFI